MFTISKRAVLNNMLIKGQVSLFIMKLIKKFHLGRDQIAEVGRDLGVSRGRALVCSFLVLNFLIILFIIFGSVWLFTKLKLSSLERKRSR